MAKKTKAKTKWFFRGTTLGWAGNTANKELPRTSATTNPLISILFARSCRTKGANPVIFICREDKIKHLDDTGNCLALQEHEKAFKIKPESFSSYTEGYIKLDDAIKVCNNLEFEQPLLMGDEMFDDALGEVHHLSEQDIERFVNSAQPLLKQD